MSLDLVVQDPQQKADACIIWLHGLGADGHDFADVPPQLNLPENHTVRFIFPHAPVRPITFQGGMSMRAWFDILGLDRMAIQDETGIRHMHKTIAELIEEQIAHGIPSHRIILAGFSQGGAMALFTGLTYPRRLGGILALSTYLPVAEVLKNEPRISNQNIPILMIHGTEDHIIDLSFAKASKNALEAMNYKVTWQTYRMAHDVCPAEIELIGQWVNNRLKAS